MNRLFNFDIRSLVQLLVRALPRLVAVGRLWRSGGGGSIWRYGLGGIIVIMAIVLVRRALRGASSRTIGHWQVLRRGGTVVGVVLRPHVRWGLAGNRRVGVRGKRVIATVLRRRVAWARALWLLVYSWLGLGRGQLSLD